MNDDNTPDLPVLGLEPDDLDGHTIEELSDYLDAGRRPADPSIERSPGCRIALDALERLRGLTPELVAADEATESGADERWVQTILSGIALDARAGRRISLASPAENADLGITEGAVRGLVRAAENAVPGALVGRCQLDGDVIAHDAPIRVRVDVSIAYGVPIPGAVERLREEVATRLAAHTSLNIVGIDIAVQDVRNPPSAKEEGR